MKPIYVLGVAIDIEEVPNGISINNAREIVSLVQAKYPSAKCVSVEFVEGEELPKGSKGVEWEPND